MKIRVLVSVLCLLYIASCGTKHCTDDNTKSLRLSETDQRDFPIPKDSLWHFYSSSGEELNYMLTYSISTIVTYFYGVDPDCPKEAICERMNYALKNQRANAAENICDLYITHEMVPAPNTTDIYMNQISVTLYTYAHSIPEKIILGDELDKNAYLNDTIILLGKNVPCVRKSNSSKTFTVWWSKEFGLTAFQIPEGMYWRMP